MSSVIAEFIEEPVVRILHRFVEGLHVDCVVPTGSKRHFNFFYRRRKNVILSVCHFYQVSPKLSIILLQIINVLGSGVFKISFCNVIILEDQFIFVAYHILQDLLTATGIISYL